ncbi:MAG: glycosyltransferase family 2 protein [Candidatus Thorarchaeota archaeon]
MHLVVVLPAYNEEETIGDVIKSINRNLAHISKLEVLVVNDGSTDNTTKKAELAGAEHIVSHTVNLGVGSAILTGIKAAIDIGADIICLMDSDGQFSSNEIPYVIIPILKQEADVVIGSRFRVIGRNIPILTIVTNLAMAALMSILLRQRFTDVECGFRALSKEAAINLKLVGGATFAHDMLLDLKSKRFKVIEVPVSVQYFNQRQSRVIESYIKYGGLALVSILRKLIHLNNR